MPTCNVAGANVQPRRGGRRQTQGVSGAVFHPELRRLARVLPTKAITPLSLKFIGSCPDSRTGAHRVMSRCSPRQTVCGCGCIGPLHRKVSMPRLCGGLIGANTERQALNRTISSSRRYGRAPDSVVASMDYRRAPERQTDGDGGPFGLAVTPRVE